MFVKIIKAWMGKQPGEIIDVSDADGKHLVSQGTAEEVKNSPVEEALAKGFGEIMGRISGALEKQAEAQLKEFAKAQTLSRRNGTKMMFGESGEGDVKGKTFGDWLLCVRRNDQKRLHDVYGSHFVGWGGGDSEGKAAMNTQTGAQGGFTVPAEFYGELMTLAAENAVVRPRATVIPMGSKSVFVPSLDHVTAPSAGDSAFLGGLVARWTEEAAAMNETEPTFKQLELIAHELSGYSKISNALMSDNGVGLDVLLKSLFGQAIGWHEDYAFLRGSGAGQPLGVVTWAGLISVTRSAASAFALADYAGVLARWLQNFDPARSCWACHPTVLAKLYQLVSTSSGNLVFLDNARERPRMMLGGLPLVVTEKLPALNTAGDILLMDCSKYVIGDRQQVEIAFSEHVAFTNNQGTWRFVSRVGGRPWMQDKVTLADASSTLSPFVTLAAG